MQVVCRFVVGSGIAASIVLASCGTTGVSQATEGRKNSVAAVEFPPGVPRLPVRIGTFTVSTAVVIPPEMQEIGHEQLKELAISNARQAMSVCTDVEVQPDNGPSHTPDGREVLTLVGEIQRIQLTGSIEEDLAGRYIWSKAVAIGSSATVQRVLALDANYRLVRADGVTAAAGSGQSLVKVPITGTVQMSTASSDGNAAASGSRVLKDGKVDRGSLAPAFEMTSSTGARSLLLNHIARCPRPTQTTAEVTK